MLVALRKFSLGDRALEPGDEVTLEEQMGLPSGRLEQLKRIRMIEERPQFPQDALHERVAELEDRIAKLEKKTRKPRAKAAA